MHYILYQSKDLEEVEESILPLFKGKDNKLLECPVEKNFDPVQNATFITYLDDENLRCFLVHAAGKKWPVGILPHRGNKYISRGLGITGNLTEAVKEILNDEECQDLDLLFCNDIPVFQALNIGDVFALTATPLKNNFISEFLLFLKNLTKIPSLSHRTFHLSADGEKISHTSALGIIVVEHPLGSVVSKRLITDSAMNDGMFNVLILAPENILQLLWFLFKSIIPTTKPLEKLPSFIGQIKTSTLKIENKSDIEFSIDGETYCAKEIDLKVQPEALVLKQSSTYITKEKGAELHKKFKIDRLPTGEKREALVKQKLPFFPRATTEEFHELFKLLKENGRISVPFMTMMILSTLIATFGLFGDSSPVIIGAMILAPIITPIVSFSMGMVRYDVNMLKSGILTILAGTLVSLVFAAGVSIIIPLKILTSEIDARLSPTLLDMGIAVASGIAAAYAHAERGIAKSLAGVAIAVALVPPLAVAGIGIGWMDWDVFSGAFLLYLTNLAGIIMFAGITFLFMGFAPFRRARMGLVYTLVIISLVLIPLSLSFNRIKEEARITRQLEGSTFNDIVLKDVKVRFGEKLRVSVRMVSPQAVDREEMQFIKNYIEDKMGRPVILEVVSAIEF